MTNSAREIIDIRLARGDISIEEHQTLLAALGPTRNAPPPPPAPLTPLIEVDSNFIVYPDVVVADGIQIPNSSVRAVSYSASTSSLQVSFLYLSKNECGLSLQADDGTSIGRTGKGYYFKNKTSRLIEAAYIHISKATFNTRLSKLIESIQSNGEAKIGFHVVEENGKWKTPTVSLMKNGFVVSDTGHFAELTFAATNGKIEFGGKHYSAFLHQHSFNPGEVTISEDGTKKKQFTFYVSENRDIILPLLGEVASGRFRFE